MVRGYSGTVDYEIVATYLAEEECGPQLENGIPCSGTVDPGEEDHYYIDVPAGATSLVVELTGDNPDADLYVRYGSAPTQSDYDCRPYTGGSDETCSFDNPNPAAGRWYIMVRGYSGTVDYQIVANAGND